MTDQNIEARLKEISDCLYRVASKAIIIKESKLLLVLEDEGWYGLPGGGIDHGQTPLQSLQRELVEEIGHESSLDEYELRPLLAVAGGSIRDLPRVTIYYKLRVSDDFRPKNIELKYKWVDERELADVELGPNIELARDQLTELLTS